MLHSIMQRIFCVIMLSNETGNLQYFKYHCMYEMDSRCGVRHKLLNFFTLLGHYVPAAGELHVHIKGVRKQIIQVHNCTSEHNVGLLLKCSCLHFCSHEHNAICMQITNA